MHRSFHLWSETSSTHARSEWLPYCSPLSSSFPIINQTVFYFIHVIDTILPHNKRQSSYAYDNCPLLYDKQYYISNKSGVQSIWNKRHTITHHPAATHIVLCSCHDSFWAHMLILLVNSLWFILRNFSYYVDMFYLFCSFHVSWL